MSNFMSDRHASIGFDDLCTEVTPLANTGLAHGSPLSLMMIGLVFIGFFNSNLVTIRGAASAFSDNYFRWPVWQLRPEQMRQPYQSCVTLVADYVSTV
ncbi:hypothetical protein VN97_g10567 [Penicillium thymicola]|uniref:Uncharacterized protein n=1 Tax=Penicillium thymicola TaxID=293382 RepID=A0AAI9TA99_PENTH|nr:hypothetical protein VN97_g10567 [Penicillium thymicola]